FPRINRFTKRGSILRRVLRRHRTDAQVFEALLGHRETNQPTPIPRHEIDCFRSDLLGSQCEIAFVLSILIVNDDDHAPRADFFQSSRNVTKMGGRSHPPQILAKAVEVRAFGAGKEGERSCLNALYALISVPACRVISALAFARLN